MKINKTYSMDFDLAEKLESEKNASGLICQLVKRHYDDTDIYKMSEKQLKEYIAREELKQEHDKQMLELNKKLAEV